MFACPSALTCLLMCGLAGVVGLEPRVVRCAVRVPCAVLCCVGVTSSRAFPQSSCGDGAVRVFA